MGNKSLHSVVGLFMLIGLLWSVFVISPIIFSSLHSFAFKLIVWVLSTIIILALTGGCGWICHKDMEDDFK